MCYRAKLNAKLSAIERTLEARFIENILLEIKII